MKSKFLILTAFAGCIICTQCDNSKKGISNLQQSGTERLDSAASGTSPHDSLSTDSVIADTASHAAFQTAAEAKSEARLAQDKASAVEEMFEKTSIMMKVRIDSLETSVKDLEKRQAEDEASLSTLVLSFFSLVALALAVLAFLKARNLHLKLKQTIKKQKELFGKIESMDDEIQKMNKSRGKAVEVHWENPSASTPKAELQPPVSSQRRTASPKKAPSAPQITTTTFYAQMALENAFLEDDLEKTRDSYTMVVLQCGSDGKGTFTVNDDPSVQSKLINNASKGFLLVADVIERKSSITHIVNVKPGIIQQNGKKWVIIKKAQVKLE